MSKILSSITPSASTTKQALSSHSWLGILVAALMYLVCLTGTVAVFYQELERWEQPQIHEQATFSPVQLQQSYQRWVGSEIATTGHMFIGLPTADIPRLTLSNEDGGWFVGEPGGELVKVDHAFTHMLADLHINLHLPKTFGVIVVSILGVMLCSLIISGFIAHPSIFKDAFKLRLFGSKRLEQVDVHNRLSVWASPFYLMIGITGAFFGLAAPLLGAYAYVNDQDPLVIRNTVFGAEPRVEQHQGPVQIAAALQNLSLIDNAVEPFFITLHDADSDKPHIEIMARHPDRLIYSESYHFNGGGEYLSKTGFSDGETGKQVIYSIYRLHFGNFDGLWAKLIYAILGLALTVVAASGVNIWLAKRKIQDYLNDLWVAVVWGAPLALLMAAYAQVVLAYSAGLVFWLVYIIVFVSALWIKDAFSSRRVLQKSCVFMLALLVVSHYLVYGAASFAAAGLLINTLLLVSLLLLLLTLYLVPSQRQVNLDPLLQAR